MFRLSKYYVTVPSVKDSRRMAVIISFGLNNTYMYLWSSPVCGTWKEFDSYLWDNRYSRKCVRKQTWKCDWQLNETTQVFLHKRSLATWFAITWTLKLKSEHLCKKGPRDMKLTVILCVGLMGFLQISQARVASLPFVPGEFTAGNRLGNLQDEASDYMQCINLLINGKFQIFNKKQTLSPPFRQLTMWTVPNWKSSWT